MEGPPVSGNLFHPRTVSPLPGLRRGHTARVLPCAAGSARQSFRFQKKELHYGTYQRSIGRRRRRDGPTSGKSISTVKPFPKTSWPSRACTASPGAAQLQGLGKHHLKRFCRGGCRRSVHDHRRPGQGYGALRRAR